MNETANVIAGLSGPAGSMVLLALVLVGGFMLAQRMIDKMGTGFTALESAVKELNESVNDLKDAFKDFRRENK